jgi:hypothetical protein
MSESSSFIKERNDAFNNEVHPGPKHEKAFITVDDSRGIAFEATQGMTREDLQRKNEQAVDDLFKQEEIGSVFEKGQKLKEKTLSHEKDSVKPTSNNNNNGIDPNDIDALKKLSDQEKGMKEPSVESSLGFIK